MVLTAVCNPKRIRIVWTETSFDAELQATDRPCSEAIFVVGSIVMENPGELRGGRRPRLDNLPNWPLGEIRGRRRGRLEWRFGGPSDGRLREAEGERFPPSDGGFQAERLRDRPNSDQLP
ncbi:hypothetical protein L596_019499 [Steinernema carpocapsae]|uniref:Uncharacterized protein n=1 Tax=Steinernema carpocapsae TaxID=34508 RepID=A0A4U5MQS3_STECR|nr:hypothetical protein L596_019499 [Steinernema carpocapsae]